MPQKFGPWEDAVTREVYHKIIEVVKEFREGSDEYLDAEDALNRVAEVIMETEGIDL